MYLKIKHFHHPMLASHCESGFGRKASTKSQNSQIHRTPAPVESISVPEWKSSGKICYKKRSMVVLTQVFQCFYDKSCLLLLMNRKFS